ncbi:MAG: hypothetical protein LBO80_01665 [Treponema sp.]|jgi:hypothetical protein|nr:hypothetical protein [Treponema sp.]
MSLFCFLWIPLFYLFRLSLAGHGRGGEAWALLLGSAAALVQLILPVPEGGGFGFSRWLEICLGVTGLPAALPLAVYALLLVLRALPPSADAAGFTLLWLVPAAIIRAVQWSPRQEPSLLVLVPLLWTAAAEGSAFFIGLIREGRPLLRIPGICGILALPLLETTSYWAFYGGNLMLGAALLFLNLIPLGLSLGTGLYKTVKG